MMIAKPDLAIWRAAVFGNNADQASVLAKYRRVELDHMRLWLAGKDVCPADAVLPGGVFFFCAAKAVKVGRHTEVLKTEIAQE
jgi:hypothetical protein